MNGILGLGHHSTMWYLNEIHRQNLTSKGGYATSPYILINSDFNEINPFLPNQFDRLIPVVKKHLDHLLELGCQKILIPNITIHETIEMIENREGVSYPIISPFSILKNLKEKEFIIIGSRYTMNSEYLMSKITANSGQVVHISDKDEIYIDNYRKRIYKEGYNEKALEELYSFLDQFSSQNLCIACTEFSNIADSEKTFNLPKSQVNQFLQSE